MTIPLHLIVAMDPNGVIGADGKIPWDIPEDRKLFQRTTEGNTVVMGKRTFDSLDPKFKPLPFRFNIVLSRKVTELPEVDVARSLADAIKTGVAYGRPIFIMGGAAVYKEGLRWVDTLHVSSIRKEYPGDVYFPNVDWGRWEKDKEILFTDFTYQRYQRRT